jgi:hypothetical protein
VRLVIVLFSLMVVAGVGCSNSTMRTYESHACSTNQSDNPLLVCSPAYDLVCINTYSVMVTNPKEAAKFDGGIRQVYVCRLACSTKADCPQAGDVCCPGDIYGKDYGKMAGCVPPSLCGATSSQPDDASVGTPAEASRPADADAPRDAGADAAVDASAGS